MTEAIGTDVEPDELDSPEFKVRASNVLTQFYQFQSNIANVTLVKANGQMVVSPSLAPDAAPIFITKGASSEKFLSRKRSGLDVGQPIDGQVTKSWVVPVRYGVYDQ